jgi:hypothetical protein
VNRLALGLLAVSSALALAIAGLVAFDRQSAEASARCTQGRFNIALWGDCGGPMAGAIVLLTYILFVLLAPTMTVLAIALVRWSGLLGRRVRRGVQRTRALRNRIGDADESG